MNNPLRRTDIDEGSGETDDNYGCQWCTQISLYRPTVINMLFFIIFYHFFYVFTCLPFFVHTANILVFRVPPAYYWYYNDDDYHDDKRQTINTTKWQQQTMDDNNN
jgi:hypothetical protein